MTEWNRNYYQTKLQVRPDDIDMFGHVHSSKYIDYVLAARYEQMDTYYGNPMKEYLDQGMGWVIKTCTLNFKRALNLGDTMLVETQLENVFTHSVVVNFRILHAETQKLYTDGTFEYVLISMSTGRALVIPDWVKERYTIRS